MSDVYEFPSGEKREARPAFTFLRLADFAREHGDNARDLHGKSVQRDRDMDLAFAAKLEAHAQNLRLLAEEARLLNHPRIRWELIMDADRLETRAVEIQAEHHHDHE